MQNSISLCKAHIQTHTTKQRITSESQQEPQRRITGVNLSESESSSEAAGVAGIWKSAAEDQAWLMGCLGMDPPRTRDLVGVLVCNQALANASVQSPKLLVSPSPSLSVCLSLCDSRAQNQNCSYVCVCVDGWVGGEQTVCEFARTRNNEAGIETPTQSAAAGRPKRAKANLRAWGSAAPPHK
jgi:hypothetical protein